jgi:hypothetical protein
VLHEARTDPAGANALGKQKILQLHAPEYRKPGTTIALAS